MVSPREPLIKPGDRVAVAWTFGTVDGVVEAVRPRPNGVHVRVRIPVLGPNDEVLDEGVITVPVSAIESVYA